MIRVLRLLEYEFEDNEMAENHMAQFQVPAIGTKAFGKHTTIRSAIITNLDPKSVDE